MNRATRAKLAKKTSKGKVAKKMTSPPPRWSRRATVAGCALSECLSSNDEAVLAFKAQALAARGDLDEAIALLERVATMAEETGARRHLWTIYTELGKLEEGHGNTIAAQRWRERARAEIQFLADHCPDDVRAAFLQLPAVREVTS